MEWSKIKNIILLLLLVVNGVLLWQVAEQEWRTATYRQEARRDAVQFLADGGIRVDTEALPEERSLFPQSAKRDQTAELSMAQVLLGSARETGKTGSYTGERGTGSFLSNGSYTFSFQDGAYPVERGDLERYVLRILAQGGAEYAATGVEERGNTVRLTLRQRWEGTDIFNCQAVVVWSGGQITAIEGQQRLIGTPVPTSQEEAMNVPTALLRFLSGVRSGGHVCSEIRALTAGYETTVSPNGTAKLTPVWQVVTDGGIFYVDGMTGALRQTGQ